MLLDLRSSKPTCAQILGGILVAKWDPLGRELIFSFVDKMRHKVKKIEIPKQNKENHIINISITRNAILGNIKLKEIMQLRKQTPK